jgi:electron transfer flavoprotein beta subunit
MGMFHSIVLVKQVPDTANISGNVMQEDGTVNRAKLPAILNHEDRVALEVALRLKDQYGGTITALTMGPPRASDILRECLYMGADQAYLISDRKFAGADTLATSYVLSEAIKKIGAYDFIFAGRQAIDGDTAQVGPQTAEKLQIPQITYLEEIVSVSRRIVTAKKKIEGGYEVVQCPLPVLMSVLKDAAEPRPFRAKRVMAFKGAHSLMEIEKMAEGNSLLSVDALVHEYESRSLFIKTLTMDDLHLAADRCGVHGSPTKVYKVDSVVLSAGGHETVEPTKTGLGKLVDQLMNDHILG